MPAQIPLGGLGAKSEATDRLFFAVLPDRAATVDAARIAQDLRVQHGLGGSSVAADRLHVTLFFVNDYKGLPEPLVVRARAAGAAVSMPPFKVSFDRVASFAKPHNSPLVLLGDDGVIGLLELRRRLEIRLKEAGVGGRSEGRTFTPHVTLLYDDPIVAEQPVEPVSWTVTELVLVHSLIGQTRHVILGRWPLVRS